MQGQHPVPAPCPTHQLTLEHRPPVWSALPKAGGLWSPAQIAEASPTMLDQPHVGGALLAFLTAGTSTSY
jgi:hypothetical protein